MGQEDGRWQVEEEGMGGGGIEQKKWWPHSADEISNNLRVEGGGNIFNSSLDNSISMLIFLETTLIKNKLKIGLFLKKTFQKEKVITLDL